ncbi:hypothetical protein [Luteibacter sp.]|uniref:hypothetical protein n=1 Tax=Luteibacter sp. TaxID=1886636 RepID=UPI003F81A92E
MTITDPIVLDRLACLADATGRDPDVLATEILRNFFYPTYRHPLINEFRWRMDVVGGLED